MNGTPYGSQRQQQIYPTNHLHSGRRLVRLLQWIYVILCGGDDIGKFDILSPVIAIEVGVTIGNVLFSWDNSYLIFMFKLGTLVVLLPSLSCF